MYAWGNYEDSVWHLTHAEGAADVDAWIDSLSRTIEKARAEEKPVAPGLHAHMGLLYSMRGELDLAQAAFETERELFPESESFINGVIARMGGDR